MYKNFFKRVIDLFISGVAIILLAPVMLVVAIIIKIDSPGPVFFIQQRVGENKKLFGILKFRSMPTTVPKDMPTHQFNAKDMLSSWQKFIRKSSLDELPQLFNIFAGQMSICGERDIIVTTKKNIVFSMVVAANSVSL